MKIYQPDDGIFVHEWMPKGQEKNQKSRRIIMPFGAVAVGNEWRLIVFCSVTRKNKAAAHRFANKLETCEWMSDFSSQSQRCGRRALAAEWVAGRHSLSVIDSVVHIFRPKRDEPPSHAGMQSDWHCRQPHHTYFRMRNETRAFFGSRFKWDSVSVPLSRLRFNFFRREIALFHGDVYSKFIKCQIEYYCKIIAYRFNNETISFFSTENCLNFFPKKTITA